jgi:hypothetical protein
VPPLDVAPNVATPVPHIVAGVEPVIVGIAVIVTAEVASDGHNVVLFIKVNVAVPAETPATTPAFVTVATDVLLLVHVPPVVGFNVVVDPTHIEEAPVMLTVGFALIVNGAVASDAQLVLVNV